MEETEKKTSGGIYIPDAVKEDRPQIGKVLAAGTGRVMQDGTIVPLQVQKDDLVFFGKFSGTDAGKGLVVLREDDVLGVIEDTK